MEHDGHTLTMERHVVVFKAVQPSSLAIEKSEHDELGHESNDVILSIFCNALVLSQTNQDRLHLRKKKKDGHQTTQYHPTTSVEKYTTHEILLATN